MQSADDGVEGELHFDCSCARLR